MKDFESIRKVREANSSVSKTVIDEFLIYFAAVKYVWMGRTPDFEKQAAKAGIDVETARSIYDAFSEKFGKMGRRMG